MSGQQATDPARKAEALRLAREHGAAEAAKRTGVKAATIRAWLHREGRAAPQPQAVELDDVERLEQMMRVEQGAALRMLAKANQAAEAGKAGDARNFSVAHGVHFDKAAQLELRVVAARERQVKLAGDQAQLLAALLEQFCEALAVPFGQGAAARRLLAGLLRRQSGEGEPLAASPALLDAMAEEARAELRAAVLADASAEQLREYLPQLGAGEGVRQLPAASDDEPGEVEEMAGPVRKVRTRGDDVEVVEGEVVAERPRSGRRPRTWTTGSDGILRREQ